MGAIDEFSRGARGRVMAGGSALEPTHPPPQSGTALTPTVESLPIGNIVSTVDMRPALRYNATGCLRQRSNTGV
jgi:hypothetical protein